MSRIGKLPVSIPAGVTVDVKGNVVHVKGPKGELTQEMHKDMLIAVEDGHVVVKRPSEAKLHKSLHGLTRTLIANMVEGVEKGYSKELMRLAETWSREAGYRQLYLETHSNLQIAIKLYKKLGFTEIERPKEVLHSTMDHFYIKHL